MTPTIFSQIIEGKLPATKVFENEYLIAIKDIHPVAPVHLLIIPKREIANLQAMTQGDFFLVTEVIKAAQVLAKQFDIEQGYRLLTNNGEQAGQTIFHLHFHLIGGRPLGSMA